MNILLYTNPHKDANMEKAEIVMTELEKHKIIYTVVKDPSLIAPIKDNCDTIVITLGGDGTILHSIENCIKYDIPIFGINIGNLGFLTEVEFSNLEYALNVLKQGEYSLENRSLIELNINGITYTALNEVLFFRNTTRLINVQLTLSDILVDSYVGDGFIVATPTGSTAYSLSCGGSIINPKTPVLALTPVNAHTLRSRPLIVGDHNMVQVALSSHATADIIVDGKVVGSMNCTCPTELKLSSKKARFVKIKGCDNFYTKLAKKLKNP
ncbi:MAG: NAD(+)/NADH kinase [Firmicutes bacterium]|nr:NAD(+)/NADH kinase [Bacillota bacterium]